MTWKQRGELDQASGVIGSPSCGAFYRSRMLLIKRRSDQIVTIVRHYGKITLPYLAGGGGGQGEVHRSFLRLTKKSHSAVEQYLTTSGHSCRKAIQVHYNSNCCRLISTLNISQENCVLVKLHFY